MSDDVTNLALVSDAEPGLCRDPDFDAYVDDFHGKLIICGQQIFASDALATDPIRYREARRGWMLQNEQELHETIVESFPHPIAHSFRRFLRGSRTAHERFEALRDAWESLIHILLALTLGELRAGDHIVEDTGIDRRWIDSQTLRERIEVVSKVAAWGGDLLSVTGLISEECSQRLIELVGHRNDVAHRAARTEAQVSRELEAVLPIAMSVMSELRWLANWELVRPTGSMKDGLTEFQRLQGSSSELEYVRLKITERQRRQIIMRPDSQQEIFALNGESVMCLAPILHVFFDEDAHHARVAILKKRQGERLIYEIVGRSQNVEVENEALAASLRELKALFVKSEQVAK